MKTIAILLAVVGLAASSLFAQDYQPPPAQPLYAAPSPAVSNSQNAFTMGGWLAGARSPVGV